jgi:hypothetical protein
VIDRSYAEMPGYANPAYARALSGFGSPLALPRSGGWLLARSIPGTTDADAIGPYPLFACRNWAGLADDLRELADMLVSVTLVTDPFGECDQRLLESAFDRVRPFKAHHVVDLEGDWQARVSKHHRYYTRRANSEVEVELSPDPVVQVAEWTELYAGLIARHGITGARRFSADSFDAQLRVPGVLMFRALRRGAPVAAHLWYSCPSGSGAPGEGVAYSHLAATTDAGYSVGAAYALHWAALEYFRGRVRWLDLGAGAGMGDGRSGVGLSSFKEGWSSTSRQAYLCGRVLSPGRYQILSAGRSASAGAQIGVDYFPAYRAGGF